MSETKTSDMPITSNEIAAIECDSYFPTGLGRTAIESGLKSTYEEDLVRAADIFHDYSSIPKDQRTPEDLERYIEASRILSGDL
jgi:hypothetical protein